MLLPKQYSPSGNESKIVKVPIINYMVGTVYNEGTNCYKGPFSTLQSALDVVGKPELGIYAVFTSEDDPAPLPIHMYTWSASPNGHWFFRLPDNAFWIYQPTRNRLFVDLPTVYKNDRNAKVLLPIVSFDQTELNAVYHAIYSDTDVTVIDPESLMRV